MTHQLKIQQTVNVVQDVKIRNAEYMIRDILTDLVADVPMENISVFLQYGKKDEPDAPVSKIEKVTIYTKKK